MWACVWLFVSFVPVMDWRPVQGVPRLSPNDCWDRLQPPCDPTDGLSGYRKWMDGWNFPRPIPLLRLPKEIILSSYHASKFMECSFQQKQILSVSKKTWFVLVGVRITLWIISHLQELKWCDSPTVYITINYNYKLVTDRCLPRYDILS